MLVTVERLTGLPIAIETDFATTDVAMSIVERELTHMFKESRVIVSGKYTCFMVEPLKETINQYGISWKNVLAYAPMS